MAETSLDLLKQTVEFEHGGTAKHVQSVPVHVSAGNLTAWNGAVQVYDLVDSPSGATRAYAWSSTVEGSLQRRFFAVLHVGPITGPKEAVKSAIVRSKSKEWRVGELELITKNR